MPRDVPIGNGNLLINFDTQYQLRDLYYPHVGRENQSEGHPFHFGVWIDGAFRWITDSGWERDMRYEADTLVTQVTLRHPDLAITLLCSDIVDFHEALYLRRIIVENDTDRSRDVHLFFHHDFHLYGNEIGDTAYYDPSLHCVIHYKDKR